MQCISFTLHKKCQVFCHQMTQVSLVSREKLTTSRDSSFNNEHTLVIKLKSAVMSQVNTSR